MTHYNISDEEASFEHALAVENIKWIAYSVVAYIIVGVGILGNLASLVVLTRPNLKGVMYVYLLGLAVSNLCVMITAVPALFDISSGLGGGHYTTAFFTAHLMFPLINSFMASSVYIIICMTVNRYISIYKPTDFQRLHTLKNARVSISLSFFFGIIFHIPLCFQNKVERSCQSQNETEPETLWSRNNTHTCVWKSNENFQVSENYVFKCYLWVSETFLRVGPIVTLAILNILIIHKFLKIARRRQSLKNRKAEMPEPEQTSMSSSPIPSRNTSTTQTSSSCASYTPGLPHLAVPSLPSIRSSSPSPSCVSSSTPEPTPSRRQSRPRNRQKVLQNSEERMLVVVLISIILLFVVCTTPAAVLSVLYTVKKDQHLGFQIFRAVANNLELLNFALNFYIYCLCSAEIRRAFVSLFKNVCDFWSKNLFLKQDVIIVHVDHV